MQKIKVGLVLLGLFAGLYYAQDVAAYCQCAEWRHEMKCQDDDELCPPPYEHIICMPAGCYDYAVCEANNCNAACGPGFYVCNNVCCPVGSGTSCECGVKADGSCKPCSGGECRAGYGYSCPAGWTPAWNQPDYDFCFIDAFGNKLCQPVQLGNAQRQTGCCSGNPDDCTNPKYTTYKCCPPGTQDICTPNPQPWPEYTKYFQGWQGTDGKTMQQRCDSPRDVFVRWGYTTNWLGQVYCDGRWKEPWKCEGNADFYVVCERYTETCACQQVAGTVTGRVYYDEGNTCSLASPWSAGGLTASLRGTSYTGAVGADGTCRACQAERTRLKPAAIWRYLQLLQVKAEKV